MTVKPSTAGAGEAVQLTVTASSAEDHFRRSNVYHRPTAISLGTAHIMISVVITAVGEYNYWWFRTRYYKEEKSILSAGSMKKEVSIVTEGSSIYFGPVLFVLTGVTQIVTTRYPGSFTVGCLLMQSYFSAIGVLCMLTMVRELWWLALAELPVALVTLAIACRAICCIEDQSSQNVTSKTYPITHSGNTVPLQHEEDPSQKV